MRLIVVLSTAEYRDARQWIDEAFSCDSPSADKMNSHFEVTIRILGGLLSIYHLSADEIFLKQAVRLVRLLSPWDFPLMSRSN